jgi:hypothetical protein
VLPVIISLSPIDSKLYQEKALGGFPAAVSYDTPSGWHLACAQGIFIRKKKGK